MKYKIGLLLSRKDYFYNVEKYGKDYNLLFITGMVGAGKSTIAKEISSKYHATILSQDWLSWSEVYQDDKLATQILNEFYKLYPESKKVAENNLWHKGILSNEKKRKLRKNYNNFLISYTQKNPTKLYIIEGIDVYRIINLKELKNRGIIIKGSSAMKCFIRRYKRDKTKDNQKNIVNKLRYLKMVVKESKTYYFKDRKILNNLISNKSWFKI